MIRMAQPQMGVQLYTALQAHKDLHGQELLGAYKLLLAACGRLYQGVEVCDGLLPYALSRRSDKGAQKLGEVLDANNLVVLATHFGDARALSNASTFRNSVDFYQALGCETIVHAYGNPTNQLGGVSGQTEVRKDAFDAFVGQLVRVKDRLAQEGIKLAYHNHHNEVFLQSDGKPVLDRILEAGIGVEMDTLWIAAGGLDPAQYLADHAGRIPIIHAKQGTFTGEGWGLKTTFLEAGEEGAVDFGKVIAAARADPVVGWILAEQDTNFRYNPVASIVQSGLVLTALLNPSGGLAERVGAAHADLKAPGQGLQ